MSQHPQPSSRPAAPDRAGPRSALSRRAVTSGVLTLPVAPALAAEAALTDGDDPASAAAALIARADRANAAFMRGNMRAWYESAGPIARDFTLMQPFGGPASRGFDSSPKHLDELAGYFAGGEARLEVIEAYASADLVVLAFVERQRGQVGRLPDQDWSLRVTQVYRRRGGSWELAHRHADPLVRNVGLERTAALARGA